MVRWNDLAPMNGAKRGKKRVGRGDSSGHGSYSGKGQKGQKSRTGELKVRPGFEGGQLPLIKSLPRKKGFTNIFRTHFSIVNIGNFNIFKEGTVIDRKLLFESGLINSLNNPVKVLADGEIKYPLVVRADKFSTKAKEKILAVNGKVEEIGSESQTKQT